MAIESHLRIAGSPPKLVGKPLGGGENPYLSEKTKKELQTYLRLLGEASDQAQVDLKAVITALNTTSGSTSLHPFLLFGG